MFVYWARNTTDRVISSSSLRGGDVSPFCLNPHENSLEDIFTCTPDGRSFGYCNLVNLTWNSKSKFSHSLYTYFGNSSHLRHEGKIIPQNYFGKVDLTDFCPFVQVCSTLRNDINTEFLQEITWSTSDGIPKRSSICSDPRNSKGRLCFGFIFRYLSSDDRKQLQPGGIWIELYLYSYYK